VKKCDVIVVGAGDVGLGIAFKAASENLKVTLIDKENVGGTCVNNGCVPSKTLICTADRIMETQETAKLGFYTNIVEIDFSAVMKRTRDIVTRARDSIKKAIEETENLAFMNSEGHFIDEYTLEVGNEKIEGKKIFVASGARPSMPPVKGLDTIQYLTNESILGLKKRPESMIFIGGGYVGLEYAHFFSAVGTKVTIIDRNLTLLPFEEQEISDGLKKEIGRRIELRMGYETVEVRRAPGGYVVLVKEIGSGELKEIFAEAVMVAAGRRSNADLLRVANAGIETDKANFIKVDDYLQTNKKHIWALGDAIGRAMFTHAGDKESELAWHNATQKKRIKMDFASVPHAVFTYPQIASVGLTETQARKDHEVLIGKAIYSDTVMGEAMAEHEGFAKAIVDKRTETILGFHIAGPHASVLIQEVVNAVITGGDVKSITRCMHIFPALSSLIVETLSNLA